MLQTHQVRQRVSKLGVELVDKTFDEPVTVDRVVHNLLHCTADGEEVVVLFILKHSSIGEDSNPDLGPLPATVWTHLTNLNVFSFMLMTID